MAGEYESSGAIQKISSIRVRFVLRFAIGKVGDDRPQPLAAGADGSPRSRPTRIE